MASIFCPACKGSGMVAQCFFALPCPLCIANAIGNQKTSLVDLVDPTFRDSLIKVETTPNYWNWLNEMVGIGQIDIRPKIEPEPKKKHRKKRDK